jgi:hypothetical protein
MNICTICNKEYKFKIHSSCTKEQCPKCYYKSRKKKRKKFAIDLFGGKCQKCGYKTSLRCLVFHHIDNKDIEISKILNGSWNRCVAELKKCVLLCANCHGELHDKLWDIDSIEKIILDDSAFDINEPHKTILPLETVLCKRCNKEFQKKPYQKKQYCSKKCVYTPYVKFIPDKKSLLEYAKKFSITKIAKIFNVQKTEVRKWFNIYNIDRYTFLEYYIHNR